MAHTDNTAGFTYVQNRTQPVMAGDRQAGQTLFHLLRVFTESQQRRVGRDPSLLEASASSSLAASPPIAFASYGTAET